MKRKFLVVGSIAFSQFLAFAQQKDTIPEKLNKTEIEFVYNQYVQDGNNSAITGGTGTEKMNVYGPLTYNRTFGKNAIGFTLGSDIVSSASVDNIDFVSSVSRVDARTYINGNYQRNINDWSFLLGGSISVESDYLSLGAKIGVAKEDNENLKNYSLVFQYYNDDLRWGRLNAQTDFKPTTLVYPVELRYQDWYDDYRRKSYNLKGDFGFVLNTRNRIGLSGEIAYQNGLLATPFHRVYFNDGSLAVEQLPDERWKGSFGVNWNTFLAGRFILRNGINLYKDSWNIESISIDNETVIKLDREFSLIPNVRWYAQSGTPYFKKYGEHNPEADYYTSDFDFSKLNSYNLGIGLKFTPFSDLNKKWVFNTLLFNYSYYRRNDGLNAHLFSLSILIGTE